VCAAGWILRGICSLLGGSGRASSAPRGEIEKLLRAPVPGDRIWGPPASLLPPAPPVWRIGNAMAFEAWLEFGFGLNPPRSSVNLFSLLEISPLFDEVGSSRARFLLLPRFKPSPFLSCKSHCLPFVAAVNCFEMWGGEKSPNSHEVASMAAVRQLGAGHWVSWPAKSKGKSLPARKKKKRDGGCPLSCWCN